MTDDKKYSDCSFPHLKCVSLLLVPLPPGVASVLGNGVVLLVYSRKRKKLRPPELMTINLAICDFGFSLLGAPFFIISR